MRFALLLYARCIYFRCNTGFCLSSSPRPKSTPSSIGHEIPGNFRSVDCSSTFSGCLQHLLPNVSVWLPGFLVVCLFLAHGPYRCGITWTTILATMSLATNVVHAQQFHGSCTLTIPSTSVPHSTFTLKWVHIVWRPSFSTPPIYQKIFQSFLSKVSFSDIELVEEGDCCCASSKPLRCIVVSEPSCIKYNCQVWYGTPDSIPSTWRGFINCDLIIWLATLLAFAAKQTSNIFLFVVYFLY